MFTISDVAFTIDSATLDAFIDEGEICWGLEINASTIEENYKRFRPRVSIELLFSTCPGEMIRWEDIAGEVFRWQDPYDDDNEPIGIVSINDHDPLYNTEIRFRGERNGLGISLEGKSDVSMGEFKEEATDIKIDTPIEFQGIWFGEDSEEECFTSLVPFFPKEDFFYEKTEEGISLLRPKINN